MIIARGLTQSDAAALRHDRAGYGRKVKALRCPHCGLWFVARAGGRIPRYCGAGCKQAAYRGRVARAALDARRLVNPETAAIEELMAETLRSRPERWDVT